VIEKNEGAKGNCSIKGGSGEIGCLQHMPNVWKWHSQQVLGYEAPNTYTNEVYVTASIVQGWLDEGQKIDKILLNWNAGENAKKCGSGRNKYGVKYNSCEYVKKGLVTYNLIRSAEAGEN